jgi:hypothetical protein
VFQVEENDLVRASKISVAAHLVSVSDPAVLSQHCSLFVGCALDSIRLENSRPMRRSGALLARELYQKLRRKTPQRVADSVEDSVAFAAAIVAAREELLAATLERCVRFHDQADLGDEARYYDPATVARCEEALEFRNEAEDILVAGRMVVENRQSIPKVLLEPLERSKKPKTPKLIEEI